VPTNSVDSFRGDAVSLTYTIVLTPEPEDGGYSVAVPLLPGCVTQGETVEECVENARDAIATFLATLQGSGEDIPTESEPVRALTVTVEHQPTAAAR
jgi:predicted RNase H-like HicB family nuclease